jgi:hypothetical protein
MGGACSTYGVREEVHSGFRLGNLKEKDHLGDLGIYGNQQIVNNYDGRSRTGLIWLMTFIRGGLV